MNFQNVSNRANVGRHASFQNIRNQFVRCDGMCCDLLQLWEHTVGRSAAALCTFVTFAAASTKCDNLGKYAEKLALVAILQLFHIEKYERTQEGDLLAARCLFCSWQNFMSSVTFVENMLQCCVLATFATTASIKSFFARSRENIIFELSALDQQVFSVAFVDDIQKC